MVQALLTPTTQAPALQWPEQPEFVPGELYNATVWQEATGRYRVANVTCHYSPEGDRDGYVAQRLRTSAAHRQGYWDGLACPDGRLPRYSSLEAAVAACAQHAMAPPSLAIPKDVQPAKAPAAVANGPARAPKAKDNGFHGHGWCAVLRWMGKNGWAKEQARLALDRVGGKAISDITISIQLKAGKTGQRGEPANLSAEQAVELQAK